MHPGRNRWEETDRGTSLRPDERSTSPESVFQIPGIGVPLQRNTQYAGGAGMLSELKTRLADLERAARAAERREKTSRAWSPD